MAKARKPGSKITGQYMELTKSAFLDYKLAIEAAVDSEDEFHINRDKILLDEGLRQKRQRMAQEEGKPYFTIAG
jgi:hypothetical protein